MPREISLELDAYKAPDLRSGLWTQCVAEGQSFEEKLERKSLATDDDSSILDEAIRCRNERALFAQSYRYQPQDTQFSAADEYTETVMRISGDKVDPSNLTQAGLLSSHRAHDTTTFVTNILVGPTKDEGCIIGPFYDNRNDRGPENQRLRMSALNFHQYHKEGMMSGSEGTLAPQRLKWYGHHFIVNPATVAILEMACSSIKTDTQTFFAGTDPFRALLATPNGRLAFYIAHDYFHSMGRKTIAAVTV